LPARFLRGSAGAGLDPLDLNLPKYDGRQLLEKIKSDLDQFISAVRQIDEFFPQVVKLPGV
jgi:hypothetical protein